MLKSAMIWKLALLATAAISTMLASQFWPGRPAVPPQAQPNFAQHQQVCGTPNATNTLTHQGRPIRLNGANIAWSTHPRFARDVGDGAIEVAAFRRHFAQIKAAGGNSARWWLHTNGTVTPNVKADGIVTGLSNRHSNEQVIAQIRQVLDIAHQHGIVVNITLFSFNMMCGDYNPYAYEKMLKRHHMSYINNALTPMVLGLRGHPALFAWEVFNEAEGMTEGSSFYGDPSSGMEPCRTGVEMPKWVLQRFVNHTAARIKEIDPNVNVTTSVGNPSHLKDYTNRALLSHPFSVRQGTLDFYQIHWYGGDYNPYLMSASNYRLDRPIVVGEYAYKDDSASRTRARDLGPRMMRNGYAGAWVWSQLTEDAGKVTESMRTTSVCTR